MNNLFLLFFLICTSVIQAQVVPNIDWVKNYSDRNSLANVPSAIDGSNNVVITGYTTVGTTEDFTTIKYDAAGIQLWVAHYNNGGSDRANAIAVDNSNNVYVLGQSFGAGTFLDYALVKYNSSGVQQWVKRYNGTGNGDDIPLALIIDNTGTGAIYVTGKSKGISSDYDYATLKYNTSGVQQWVHLYNGSGNSADEGIALALGTGNRLYVTGTAKSNTTGLDIATIRLNSNTGAMNWVNIKNGTANTTDQSFAMVLDGTNLVIAGKINNTGTGDDYSVHKINGNTGVNFWSYTYDGFGGNDLASSIARDLSGNLLVTGIAPTVGGITEYHTIKLNNSGVQQWINKESIGITGYNIVPKITVDILSHMYILGQVQNPAGNSDVYIYQVTPTGGNTTWKETHNGAANGLDAGVDFLVNNIGQIYIAAQTKNSAAKFDYTTIKISQTPVYTPVDNSSDVVKSKFLYYKNQGQLRNQLNQPTDVEYYTLFGGPQTFMKKDRLSFLFSKSDSTMNPDTLQRIDLKFFGANQLTKTFTQEEDVQQANYFLPHCGTGISGHGNKRLMIPNLFPNIDLHYYSNENGIKFYAIVKPGGNPNDFILELTSASEDTIINYDSLILKAFNGTVNLKFEAYQVNPALHVLPMAITPQLVKVGTNQFKVINLTSYNPFLPLVFKFSWGEAKAGERHLGAPDWSTSFGGTGVDVGTDVKNDADGNSYWCGYTNSINTTFPSTTAPVINASFGNFDAVIYKFGSPQEPAFGSPAGFVPNGDKLLWLVFWGGTNDDKALALDVKGNTSIGSVFVTGFTESSDFLTIAPNEFYNDSYSGGKDAFLIRLDYTFTGTTSGTLKGSYIGGSGDDIGNDIKFKSNTLSFGGITFSAPSVVTTCGIPNTVGDVGFPICSSVFHNSNAGNGDGFLLQVDNTSSLLAAEFIGGTGYDELKELVFNFSGDIYFTGITGSDASTFNPINSFGAYNQNFNGGGMDAFIGRYKSSPWLTFFGGSGEDDGRALTLRPSTDGIIVVGNTGSNTPECSSCYCAVPTIPGEFPLCPSSLAHFQQDASGNPLFGGGNKDGFIAEFNSSNEFIWGTYKGGDKDDYINAVTIGGIEEFDQSGPINLAENIMVTGETFSCDDMTNNNDKGMYYYDFTTIVSSYFNIVSDDPCLAFPSSWSTIASNTYFGLFSELNKSVLLYERYPYFYPSYPTTAAMADQIHTSFNAVSTWGSHFFFNGSTTNDNYLFRVGSGMDFSGNLGAWQDSEAWVFNQALSFDLNNIPSDIAMVRFSQMEMPMYNSIKELENTITLASLVFPNPATESINVKYDGKEAEDIAISIYDINGKIVYSGKKQRLLQGNIVTINVSSFESGVYCVLLSTDKTRTTHRIIKQ